MLREGEPDVLGDGPGTEERAVLEQDAHALEHGPPRVVVERGKVFAEHLDRAAIRRLQSQDRAQQDGLAGSGAADDRKDLAAPDFQIDAVMDRLRAEAGDEIAHADDGLVHRPICEKKIEKAASNRMTRKIDLTTERVVWMPTLSADPETFSPS